MTLAAAAERRAAHPQWWVLLAVGAAWVGVAAGVGFPGAGSGGHDHAATLHGAGGWMLMVVAMMVPLRLPLLREVAHASLPSRRHRSVVVVLLGFVAVWALSGLVLLEAHHVAEALVGRLGAAVVAVGWLVVWARRPAYRRAGVRCGRMAPLAPLGWCADRDAARLGLRAGWSCVQTCWATMAFVVAVGHHPLVMLAVTVFELRRRVRAA